MQNHPLVEAAHRLQGLVSNWSQTIEGPRRQAIGAAQVELDEAHTGLEKLRDELDEMRRDMVLKGLDRRALRTVRGKIHDAEVLICDLEVGILEAERQCLVKAGVAAVEACRNLVRATTAIRTGRAAIIAEAERGGDPARNAKQVLAEIGSARARVDEAVAEVHRLGEVPERLEDLVAEVRASLDTVAAEVSPYDTLRKAA